MRESIAFSVELVQRAHYHGTTIFFLSDFETDHAVEPGYYRWVLNSTAFLLPLCWCGIRPAVSTQNLTISRVH